MVCVTGAADSTSHRIFIWDLASGQFATSLDGGRELLTDMDVSRWLKLASVIDQTCSGTRHCLV